jgi:hypothetical protein
MSETLSPIGAIAKYVKYEIPKLFAISEAKLAQKLADDLASTIASVPVIQGKDGAGIEAPQWESGIYRKDAVVHDNLGQFFKAKQDTVEPTDNREHWERIGKFGFRFCGGHKKDVEYQDGDLTVKDFSLMLHIGGEFKVVAGRGKTGERGERGLTGQDGRNGHDGDTIDAFELAGSRIVMVKTAYDGTVTTHELELSPIFKIALDLQQERLDDLQKALAEETFLSTKEFFLNHPVDEAAIPLRFWRGSWRLDGNYHKGDVVDFGGYVCLARRDSKGVTPFGSFLDAGSAVEYWQMIARSIIEYGSEGSGGGSGGGWSAVNATQTERGIIMLATEQEAIDGINTADAITPATLQAKLDDYFTPPIEPPPEPPKSVKFDFSDSTAIGTFTHNMAKYPSVRVVDTGGNWWIPKTINFPTLNTIIIEFDLSFGGTLILS